MNSLRWQLLAWLMGLYLVSAALALGVSYRQYQTSVSAFMDGQMHALALSYTQQMPAFKDVRPINTQQVEHDGSLVVQFLGNTGLLYSSWPIPALASAPQDGFNTVLLHGHAWRVYTSPPAGVRMQVVQSGDFRQRVILDSAWKSVEPIAFIIPASIVLLWLAVFLALRPVNRLVQAIAAQDEHHLTELPLQRVPAELRPLIGSMNGLLARLGEAFAAQQRFVQDAAHELRTPLTALKLQVENLRHKLVDPAGGEIARLEAGIERMQRLVEQLLHLARQEAAAPHTRGKTDVREVLKESVSALLPLAEARGIDLGFTAAEPAEMLADAGELRSVFDNLLDNALRYTPAGGRVDVSLHHVDGTLSAEFTDTGPGIPPELLERVFDRFYRVLGTGTQGSGLGLAIARTAAGRSGMRIELLNRGDQSGLVARVRFT